MSMTSNTNLKIIIASVVRIEVYQIEIGMNLNEAYYVY